MQTVTGTQDFDDYKTLQYNLNIARQHAENIKPSTCSLLSKLAQCYKLTTSTKTTAVYAHQKRRLKTHALNIKDVPNSGFRLFGRIRIVL